MRVRSVVAVQNYGISGTLFLQSLLDNHPDILALPALYAQQLYPYYELWHSVGQEAFIAKFLADRAHWFDAKLASTHHEPVGWGLHQMGEEMSAPLHVDRKTFESFFRGRMATSDLAPRRRFVEAVFIAFAAASGKDRDRDVVLLYPIHSLPRKYAVMLLDDFENVSFLHMVRDPIQNMGSLIKHVARYEVWNGTDVAECAFGQVLNDWQIHGGRRYQVHGFRPFFDPGSVRSGAIRLEDLHNDPRGTMNRVAEWMGIAWNDSLLESTFNGLKWWNRPESVRVSGFSDKPIAQKHFDVLPRFDRFRLSFLLRRQISAWDYGEPRNRFYVLLVAPLLLFPFKAELQIERLRKRAAHQPTYAFRSIRHPWLRRILQVAVSAAFRVKRVLLGTRLPVAREIIHSTYYATVALQQYAICRYWLFRAWAHTLMNREALVPWLGRPSAFVSNSLAASR